MYAGEIAAILGLKDTFTGDTLCDATQQIVLENISFPEPVISVAIVITSYSIHYTKLYEKLFLN